MVRAYIVGMSNIYWLHVVEKRLRLVYGEILKNCYQLYKDLGESEPVYKRIEFQNRIFGLIFRKKKKKKKPKTKTKKLVNEGVNFDCMLLPFSFELLPRFQLMLAVTTVTESETRAWKYQSKRMRSLMP